MVIMRGEEQRSHFSMWLLFLSKKKWAPLSE